MGTTWRDIRSGLRTLRASPGFSAAVLLTLMLGIGANSAIFSVVNAVLLRPLPFRNPERLVVAWTQFLIVNLRENYFSPVEFRDVADSATVFEGISPYQEGVPVNLTGVGEPERLISARVSPDLFPLLGIHSAMGRVFTADEAKPGNDDAVLLSHDLWQRRFGGKPGLIGQTVSLDGRARTVVGVLPPGVGFPKSAELWTPLAIDWAAAANSRGSRYLQVVARLKPGVSLQRAQAEMTSIAHRMQQAHPDSYPENAGWGVALVPLKKQLIGDVGKTLFVWFGAVGLLLLIACTNVANLLLARAKSRDRELSVRAALGAKPGRLARQLVTETLVFSILGGLLSLLVAHWGVKLILGIYPEAIPRAAEVGLDATVFAFTFGLSILAGVVLGLIPALQLPRRQLSDRLKEGGTKATAFEHRFGLRNVLVVTQIALSLVVLVGAGLLVRSFEVINQVAPGFEPSDTHTFELTLPRSKYAGGDEIRNFYGDLLEKIQGSPGVESVGLVSELPFSGTESSGSIFVEGHPLGPDEIPPEVGLRQVSGGYFHALGIPLLAGRTFAEGDAADSPAVVVVDQKTAKQLWSTEDPLGKQISLEGPDGPWIQVVGVVGDVKQDSLSEQSRMQVYFPYTQFPSRSAFLVVRSPSSGPSIVPEVRHEIASIDRDLPIGSIETMEQRLSESLARRRFSIWILGGFALLAIVLTALGIYSLLSFQVVQQTREIGIRMAMGASRSQVLGMIVTRGMRLAAVGIVLGILCGLGATRWMKSLLYGVSPLDLPTFVAVVVMLAAISVLASFVPARRAALVEPVESIRDE